MSAKNDLISRSALLKRIFPYEVVDKREYSINAKAVEKAILDAPAARSETVITLHGYNAEALVLIAEMLRNKLVCEGELDEIYGNFQKMYNIIVKDLKAEIEETTMKFTYPSLGEVYMRMQEAEDGK